MPLVISLLLPIIYSIYFIISIMLSLSLGLSLVSGALIPKGPSPGGPCTSERSLAVLVIVPHPPDEMIAEDVTLSLPFRSVCVCVYVCVCVWRRGVATGTRSTLIQVEFKSAAWWMDTHTDTHPLLLSLITL